MANITALLAALSNLPPMTGAPPLTPLPAPVNAPTDFILPGMLAGPEVPPPSPTPPLDQSIIQKYLALAGAPPTPPPAQAPPGALDKLSAALLGISAGIQGQGPQYAAALREERQRPQREFEARQQQYEQMQRQLGLRGLEAAQGAQERQQTREDRAAEMQFNRDFQESMRKLGITDTLAIEKMKEGAQIQLAKERERAADEKLASQQKAQQERDARQFAAKYRAAGATGTVATELGNYDAKLTDQLSPAAAKWESAQSQANQIRAQREARLEGRLGGGGGGGTNVKAQKALQQFEAIQQQVAAAQARGDAQEEMALRRQMRAAHNRLARFPGQFDLGYDQNGMPYAKPRTGAAPQPPAFVPGPYNPTGQPQQMYFDLSGKQPAVPQMNRAQAKAKLIANGYKSAEADAELNRLGIK